MKSALILHPYKPVKQDLSNGFSQEMAVLANYLFDTGSYFQVHLYTGGYINFNRYDEIWLSCFKYSHETALLNRLRSLPAHIPIKLVCNDPDFFAMSEEALPQASFGNRIEAKFCGSDYEQALALLGKPANNHYYIKQNSHLPLWQAQFAGKRPKAFADLSSFTYSIGYAGNNRSKYRSTRIADIVGNKAKACFVSWDAVKLDNATYYEKKSVAESTAIMQTCLAQLVTGDESYKALMPGAHRLLQGLAISPLVFVDRELGNPFEDYPLLKEHLLVSNSDELCEALFVMPLLFNELVSQCNDLFKSLTEL